MKQERFTELAQEALAGSQDLVRQYQHTQWDVEHVLLALLQQERGLVGEVLNELNIDAAAVSSSEEVRDGLVQQVDAPVLWAETVRRMRADGFDTFVEVEFAFQYTDTYSESLDLGITNWNNNKGNYLFMGTSAVGAPVIAAASERLTLRPNPVRTSTVFTYDGRGAARARLAIYDVAGRAVRTLHEGPIRDGLHTWEWQARGDAGARVASGVYFARFQVGERTSSIKVVVR